MSSYANAIQRAITVVLAVVRAAGYIAFNAIIRGAFLLIHISLPPIKISIIGWLFFGEIFYFHWPISA